MQGHGKNWQGHWHHINHYLVIYLFQRHINIKLCHVFSGTSAVVVVFFPQSNEYMIQWYILTDIRVPQNYNICTRAIVLLDPCVTRSCKMDSTLQGLIFSMYKSIFTQHTAIIDNMTSTCGDGSIDICSVFWQVMPVYSKYMCIQWNRYEKKHCVNHHFSYIFRLTLLNYFQAVHH